MERVEKMVKVDKIIALMALSMCVAVLLVLSFLIFMLLQPSALDKIPESSGDTVHHTAVWYYDAEKYVISYDIDMGEVRQYQESLVMRNLSKTSYHTYSSNYTDTIRDIADKISILSTGMGDADRINMVSKFVNYNILYEPDSTGFIISDYFQYPIETLYLATGDCEDMAILTVAILKAMGYDSEVISCWDHAITGVNVDCDGTSIYSVTGKKYVSLDSTCGGRLGDYDEDMIVVTDCGLWVAEMIFFVSFMSVTMFIGRCAWDWYCE